ncbi:hypothetical protein [Rhizobium sp. L51/94]|uniref:hypothetical protein n=1 Tax=Rhizobium sp. L51/94 TaxID=2819999 RepID=UPI001C5ABECC|nr:hypothetical protein [Rhizobium sp. L51/94]QXZ79666.1 hypothetical protein J5274_06700 [Rhizobium sp. L51/94]
MTIKLRSVAADVAQEKKGIWISSADLPGVDFLVSSLYSPEYETARDLLLQRLGAQFKGATVPTEILLPRLGTLYAEHLLHGWRGFDEEYSREVAAEILGQFQYRDIIKAVEWCAGQVTRINFQFVDKDAGNSGKPSARA